MKICTHVGWATYDGKSSIYDGNFEPTFQGSEAQVIKFLSGLKCQVIEKWPGKTLKTASLSWRGTNGWWYEGREALNTIQAEIDRLRGAESRYQKIIEFGGSEDEAFDAVYNP